MRYYAESDLMAAAHDVTLLNGAKHRCIDATVLCEIPNAERPRGKWVMHNNPCYSPFDGSSAVVYICSLCEYLHDSPSNYCEWCGAEMRRGNV